AGGSSTNPGSAGPALTGLANTGLSSSPHHGGTLHLISAEGWLSLDPGKSYFQIDYMVVYATQTPLYIFNPVTDKETPLLASSPPTISPDGKTVTVHIKSGFRFSPPVNRPVTSADVAYAFQRDFNPNIQNGYAGGYYPLVGAA